MAREGEMKQSRLFEMLYGISLVPIVVIIGGTMWTFLFLAAHSNPNALLVWAAAFIVWLVLALEGFNRMIFDRQALPWLPLPGPMMPLEVRFAALLFAYGVIGFVGYKKAMEPQRIWKYGDMIHAPIHSTEPSRSKRDRGRPPDGATNAPPG